MMLGASRRSGPSRRSRAGRALTGGRGRSRPRKDLKLALAGFAAVCGLGLLVFGGSGPTTTQPTDLTKDAIDHARAAERALVDKNYGSARQHLMSTQELLGRAVEGRSH